MTTTKELNEYITELNKLSKRKYALNHAYGETRIVRKNEKGGETNISNRVSNKEIENILSAIIQYLDSEART